MSGGFDEREKAAEARWAHDEELRFKVMARRNKLLGLWAAGEMGIKGTQSEAYAKEVVRSDLAEPGQHDVFRKIRKDFDARKLSVTDHAIHRKMEELLKLAGDQVVAEGK